MALGTPSIVATSLSIAAAPFVIYAVFLGVATIPFIQRQ